MLLYAYSSISYVTSGISYEYVTNKLDIHYMFVSRTLCISSDFLIRFQRMSAY